MPQVWNVRSDITDDLECTEMGFEKEGRRVDTDVDAARNI